MCTNSCLKKDQLDDETSKMLKIYHEGLELYNAQKWNVALKKFDESAKLEDEFPTRPTTQVKCTFCAAIIL